ncbi:MAG: hypothetical protein LAQ30_11290 [Acidobacteriia bacterium]|nr:hypothetical protein [Terriglobia bacterium]
MRTSSMMAPCSTDEGGGAIRGSDGGSTGLAATMVRDWSRNRRRASRVLGPMPRLSICSTERSSSRSVSVVLVR